MCDNILKLICSLCTPLTVDNANLIYDLASINLLSGTKYENLLFVIVWSELNNFVSTPIKALSFTNILNVIEESLVAT